MNISPTSSLEKWLDNFLSYQQLAQKDEFWLNTMHFLCGRFAHPEKCAPCIHVAGSKGKGSVTAMVASIIEEKGYKCGLYQSPHICDFRERVKLAHDFFPDEIYIESAAELIGGIESIPIEDFPNKRPATWFELITLYAFLCFRRAKVDFAVYEVGLGGKLDATNVVTPDLCLITEIELEHTEFLGETIEKIAAEKAGIIKQTAHVIAGKQTCDDAYTTIENTAKSKSATYERIDSLAKEIKSTPIILKNDINGVKLYTKIDIKLPFFQRNISASLMLLGNVQAENAALASTASKIFIPSLTIENIEHGLEKAFLPGRFEVCNIPPNFPQPFALILDGAHTKTSISNSLKTLEGFFRQKKYHALFACAKDKDVVHIAPLFSENFSCVTITKPGYSKETDTDAVCSAFKKSGVNFYFEDDTKTALKISMSKAEKENAVLLVIGSFYLVAEVTEQLRAEHAC